ncbi:HD-GYP domain-containing protein [Saccharibacillus sp. CPCC 101409]|uniref:HD-GYP domain-containing protein n=1 Tax=Saccharibacillus sp. CPCC 101409 TaxID=3058041 RepID=UPI002673D97D|nr:HD-GYP domain-containing protein [Saccharibacillus sp. CPCC 101409]MDO3408841.1 HD-GYP domain-containing protein [Saccharibacillus sp. CPCC 101409]
MEWKLVRLLSIGQVKPGTKLGKRIYNEDGLTLLAEGAELTGSIIRRLGGLGIDMLYIRDEATEDVIVPEMIQSETRRKSIKQIRTVYRSMMDDKMGRMTYPHLGYSFRKMTEEILSDLGSREDVLIMLGDIHTTDHYLYTHSFNVCLYTLTLGIAAGYSKEDLFTLGMGSLLHDIGKTRISQDVLLKPGRLTDDEFKEMKRHTEFGYAMLKDEAFVPLLAAHCAFQHHERLDGSGYPRGIRGKEIQDFAKWIAITDSYDAMTTNRVYRRGMLPHQAVDILYGGSCTQYDQHKLEMFRDKVALYPVGLTVKLSTGETGVVTSVPPKTPNRPVVRVIEDAEGASVQPYEIDLSVRLSVMVEQIADL